MSRRAVPIVAVLAAALAGGWGAGEPAAPPAGVVQISMRDTAFVPERARARVGQTVRWVNDDPDVHTVASSDGADFGSPGLERATPTTSSPSARASSRTRARSTQASPGR